MKVSAIETLDYLVHLVGQLTVHLPGRERLPLLVDVGEVK